jgi:16S rRNA (adenine1518-N6/adenine1519-N6)-dimethyltransferase
MNGHRPRKRFGQNFLHDPVVIDRIIAAFHPQADDIVAEIGPGQGALTGRLADKVAQLYAIELDRDLVATLAQRFGDHARVHIVQGDALRFDFCSLVPGHALRVIGNLPYNISTPLLFHLLDQAACVRDMLFMLQKEVVQRMVAVPGGKDYGRLSVMTQWRCAAEKLFTVAPGSFHPAPKVDSAIVRLRPYAAPQPAVSDPARFARIVQAAFAQRRKTLRNVLRDLVAATVMEDLGIDPGRRPETLSVAEFAALANAAG